MRKIMLATEGIIGTYPSKAKAPTTPSSPINLKIVHS